MDFYILAIREGKTAMVEAAMNAEGFPVDTIDAFIGEIEGLIREDQEKVETLKQALHMTDDGMVDLARTILRSYGLKE